MVPGAMTLCFSGRSLFAKVDYTQNSRITVRFLSSGETYHRTGAQGVIGDFLPDKLLFPLLLGVAGHGGFRFRGCLLSLLEVFEMREFAFVGHLGEVGLVGGSEN